jgi:CRISPR-associated endonuclease/helicase Cas3
MMTKFIAHFRVSDGTEQSVEEHLENVSIICSQRTRKIGLPDTGELLGLLHDFGKFSQQFQHYIQSATGLLNPDIDGEYVDSKSLKGKIDHSTAGAQWVWEQLRPYGVQGRLVGQVLAVCLASHHGGLLDCLKPDGKNGFSDRINKGDRKTHLQECVAVIDKAVRRKFDEFVPDIFLRNFCKQLIKIMAPQKKESDIIKQFRLGFFTRFLFSCLIDADRIDSADFENPSNVKLRSNVPIDWQIAIGRLEEKLACFQIRNPMVDPLRRKISDQCRQRADGSQGIFTLTVPTGGGKTFASMRYALHHAHKHGLDHIIYIIPYTSIIEQNAAVIREILEREGDAYPWVLEHHSNLEPEQQTWQSKLVCENWDAPIIFTTMVQFLEVLFGGGTRGARRMHTIANSVLIFDEIQSLPINCVHLFCNALQFFVDHTNTTAVICTATQPLLDKLKVPENGQLSISAGSELVDDVAGLFARLKRVEIQNFYRPGGWSEAEIAELTIQQFWEKGNCLVIVNTKKWARKLYERCRVEVTDDAIFHLSTSLCPAHRKKILGIVTQRLNEELPTLCISTQLIEAGVDVDFNAVIRFLAGLDSIAQAAGRCNRNGKLDAAQVYVVNPQEEPIDMLHDIKVGREKALRIFSEKEHDDFLSPAVMTRYFSYYFYERANLMTYPLTEKQAGRKGDTMLNLLSDNCLNVGREKGAVKLQQSFRTAGKAFKAIDAPTQAVIVPFEEGREIIAGLCAEYEPSRAFDFLRKAQQYSVNVFPNIWEKLKTAGAVTPIQEGEEIYYLDERFYSKDFGLAVEVVANMSVQIG